MALLRMDARPLLPGLRAELVALLAGLARSDWALPTACPGWSVHDVAAHLLGVELGNVSVRRDRWALGPGDGEDLDSWLNRFNQQWVEAARRISPALLVELTNLAGLRFEEHLATLDLDAPAARWSGRPVPTRRRSGSMSLVSTWNGTSTSGRSATPRAVRPSGRPPPPRSCRPRRTPCPGRLIR